jgi:hypothetical protein
MSSFDIIETPEMKLEKMLSDLDVWITPFAEIDSKAFNFLAHFNSFFQRSNLKDIDKGQLTGPILNRMLYQYCAIVGQLEIHVRMIPNERTTFLNRAKDVYCTNIEWIERTYGLGHPVQAF